MSKGKKYVEAAKKINRDKQYSIKDAIKVLKDVSYANFDESVELHFSLGIDPRHADQMVRGTMILPHGTGKSLRVVVVTSSDKEAELKEAGAVEVGGEELIAKIQGGWLDFDILVTSPDMMAKIARLGKLLGARGLMPNPKSGTVTTDLEKAVKEFMSGKVEYRNDKTGNVHLVIGKKSFDEAHLEENYKRVLEIIKKAKPAKAKGDYIKSATLTSTMAPGIKLEIVS